MAAIQGLTEAQCQAFTAVQVGDMVLMQSYSRSNDEEEGISESEAGSEGFEDDEEVAQDGGETQVGEGGDQNEAEDDAEDESDNGEKDDDKAEDEEEDEENEEEQHVYNCTLYSVYRVTKDNDGQVTDVELCTLIYNSKPAQSTFPCFQLYGANITSITTFSVPAGEFRAKYVQAVTNLVSDDTLEYSFNTNVSGDTVRNTLFGSRCPTQCRDGWIATQQQMHELVEGSIRTVAEHSPICPVCLGKDLMEEYQALRETLEDFLQVDIGLVIEFHGRLNTRRRQLGYRLHQFDEREWGLLFDDMDAEHDEDDRTAGNHGQWGYWPEAMDPSSCVPLRPASEAFIASLPRKTFAEVEKSEEGTQCLVCNEQFGEDTAVVELPCGHLFCNGGCIEHWLSQFNNCPTCRSKVPAKEDEQRPNGVDSVANASADEHEANDVSMDVMNGAATTLNASANDDATNGHDMVMSGVAEAGVV